MYVDYWRGLYPTPKLLEGSGPPRPLLWRSPCAWTTLDGVLSVFQTCGGFLGKGDRAAASRGSCSLEPGSLQRKWERR